MFWGHFWPPLKSNVIYLSSLRLVKYWFSLFKKFLRQLHTYINFIHEVLQYGNQLLNIYKKWGYKLSGLLFLIFKCATYIKQNKFNCLFSSSFSCLAVTIGSGIICRVIFYFLFIFVSFSFFDFDFRLRFY